MIYSCCSLSRAKEKGVHINELMQQLNLPKDKIMYCSTNPLPQYMENVQFFYLVNLILYKLFSLIPCFLN